MRAKQRNRYAWAKKVDPKGVAKFERQVEERRTLR
jgi:hypothetical protein